MAAPRLRLVLATAVLLLLALSFAGSTHHGLARAARGATDWGAVETGLARAHRTARGNPRVTIAIVDTGVDPHVIPGRLVGGASFLGSGPPVDLDGHGTSVALIAAAACPHCSIMPVRVLGKGGRGSYDAIARGIRYAADHGARVVNLSLTTDAWNAEVTAAVLDAEARGAVVVAAAGNDGSNRLVYPAATRGVLSVAGAQPDGRRVSDSDWGPWVALAAPGCAPARRGAAPWFCGTSAATPYVSGAAALYLSHYPRATAADVALALTESARPVSYAAAGLLRADAALRLSPSLLPLVAGAARKPSA